MVTHASARHLMIAIVAIFKICTGAALPPGTSVALAEVNSHSSATANDKATEVFDELWRHVQDNSYDPKLHGFPSTSAMPLAVIRSWRRRSNC